MLYALGNQMATSTGTVTLRADFANDDEALFPNEFVNVKILVDTLSQALLVPTPAVLSGAPGDYVYLVNADDTVSVRKVALGPSDGTNTAILSGLSRGRYRRDRRHRPPERRGQDQRRAAGLRGARRRGPDAHEGSASGVQGSKETGRAGPRRSGRSRARFGRRRRELSERTPLARAT